MYVICHLNTGDYVMSIGRDRHGYVHPLHTKFLYRAKKYKTLSGATRARRRVTAVWGAGYKVMEVSDLAID